MRRALWATTAYNLMGVYLLAFPASVLGQFAGLPSSVPLLYRALVAVVVLLFGGVYAWLATRPVIDRPLVAVSGLGKLGFFCTAAVLWILDEAPARSVLLLAGDLAFAAIFFWWLLGAREGAAGLKPEGAREP